MPCPRTKFVTSPRRCVPRQQQLCAPASAAQSGHGGSCPGVALQALDEKLAGGIREMFGVTTGQLVAIVIVSGTGCLRC